MLTYEKFRQRYHEKASKLLNNLPNEDKITAAYKSYVALVEITGNDGDGELEFRKQDDEIKFEFCPSHDTLS